MVARVWSGAEPLGENVKKSLRSRQSAQPACFVNPDKHKVLVTVRLNSVFQSVILKTAYS